MNRRSAALGVLLIFGTAAFAQQGAPPAAAEKAPQAIEVIKRAIAARGGERYLSAVSEVGRGQFTPFKEGVSQNPIEFIDSIVYPDRERTQFGKRGSRVVQSNDARSGWIFDADAKSLKEQTEEQIREHQDGMKFGLDAALKTGWKDPAVTLKYIGKKEAWRLQWGEAVELLYPGQNRVVIFFDLQSHLPFSFAREHENAQGARVRDEDRFSQWVDRGGINSPNIIDHYIDNVQANRIYYSSLEYNVPIEPRIFAKPASIKNV